MKISKLKLQNDKLLIKSIIHIQNVYNYISNMDYNTFKNDTKTVDACITRLTQIGELERRFDTNFKQTFSEIPWKEINGLRNIIVHNYDSVDYDTLWETIQTDLPNLEEMYLNLLINIFEYSLTDLKNAGIDIYPLNRQILENELEI
ncbi:DUF86 domain-containing protein [[Clostridium] spiroforme]|nr:DUF86 domain-containing protein [Thomasclavelia spiroformis]